MTDRYSLCRHLDSAAAPPLAADLLERRGKPLQIDASKLVFAGALGLQVLIAAKRQWQDDGHFFSIAPTSPQLNDAAIGLGIELEAIGVAEEAISTAEASL